jgi:hypothetical protein
MTAIRRAADWAAAPALSIALYWRAFTTWFQMDDFAWLQLPLQYHGLADLPRLLFAPKAQGTVRFLSERLFFLVFSGAFGLHALPFRLLVFATWFGALTLAALICTRLTGSRAAGLMAACLWAANPNFVWPLAWASAYNQPLCAFLLLAAFYSHLRWQDGGGRKWAICEWVAYLAAFGALEIAVIYPALVLCYHLCCARARWRSALPLFVPAIFFAALHLFIIPKPPSEIYTFAVDSRIASTFVKYAAWSAGPSRLGGLVDESLRNAGYAATMIFGFALASFAALRLWRRQWLAMFCLGWFVIAIAPVLPLPNHLTDYYTMLPAVGIAWLAGWGIVEAWRLGMIARLAISVLAGGYVIASFVQVDSVSDWFRARADRIHGVVSAVDRAAHASPGATIVLSGVDNELFQSGFQDDPFKLVGASQVYLAPGSEQAVQARADLGGVRRFRISQNDMLAAIMRGNARMLNVGAEGATVDVTDRFRAAARAQYLAEHRNFVDVGDPAYASRLGPTWHPAENGFRWMPKTATLQIAGPASKGAKLYVTGYAAPAALANGPVTLRFRAAGQPIGSATLDQPGQRFALDFALPETLVGRETIEIAIEVSRTFFAPNDPRELGMIFGTFEMK